MRVEPKASFAMRERNLIESSSTSHSIICHECLHLAFLSLFGIGANDEFFLVGQEPKRKKKYYLGFLGRVVFTME